MFAGDKAAEGSGWLVWQGPEGRGQGQQGEVLALTQKRQLPVQVEKQVLNDMEE